MTLAAAAGDGAKPFDIPAGDAIATLRQFVTQSGAQLLYSADEVEGVRTAATKGSFRPVDALARMVAGTSLTAGVDEQTGALTLRRRNAPAAPAAGGAAPPPREHGSLAGRVSNAATRTLLRDAQVAIPALGRVALTDVLGEFVFRDLPPGEHVVTVEYAGLDAAQATVRVSGGRTVARDFDLTTSIYQLGQFTVTGEREGNAASIARQRNAPGVKNVIALDAMGVLPNDNLGELLVRLPGVAGRIDDSGEILGVQIRGAEPTQSAVMVDGVRMASGGGFARDFQINKMSGAMFEEIELTKAVTPEMDADSIGGAINLKTRSPLAMKESQRFSYRAGFRWAPTFFEHIPIGREDALNPIVNASYQGKFSAGSAEPNLGIALATFYSKLTRTSRYVRYDYEYNTSAPSYVPTYVDFDNSSPRWQKSINLKFDYRLSERSRFFLNGLYNDALNKNRRYTGQATTGRTLVTFNASGAPTGTGTIYPDYTDSVTRVRGLNASVFSLAATANPFLDSQRQIHGGGEHQLGRLKLDYEANYSRSQTIADDGASGGIVGMDARGVGWILDHGNPDQPRFTQTEGPSIYRGASYTNGQITRRNNKSLGELLTASANASYEADLSVPLQLKSGVRFRRHDSDGTVESRLWTYVGPDRIAGNADDDLSGFIDPALRLSQWRGAQTLPFPDIGLMAAQVRENSPRWTEDPYRTETQRLQGERSVREEISAAYLQGQTRWRDWRALAGVRMERTEVEGSGNVQARVLSTTAQRTANPISAARADFANPRAIAGGYTDWFPSVHLTYNVRAGLQARASWSTGISRPAMGNLVPRETANNAAQTLTINNPSLKPQYTENLDLALEYYFEPVGLASVGVFRKNLRDYIVSSNAGTVGPGVNNGYKGDYAGYTLVSQFNGGTAEIEGLEIAYQQQFTFLPGPFKGLGVGASYTRLRTEGNYGTAANSSTSEVANFIPETINVSVSYNYRRFSIRYMANRNSSYLTAFNADPSRMLYKFARTGANLNTSYRLHRGVDLFCNFENLTDEPQRYYLYSARRLQRTISTGTFITFGVNGTF